MTAQSTISFVDVNIDSAELSLARLATCVLLHSRIYVL